jgi:ketosteroid isomerase-like protein
MSAKRATYGSTILIAALVGIGVGNARAQTDADVAAVTAANNAFYTAMSGLDAAAMEKVWAPEAYITNIGPREKTVTIGSPVVQNGFKSFFPALAQMTLKPVNPQVHINGNVAWTVGLETGEAKAKDGTPRQIANLVTNIFEKKDGRWLLVAHQAQPVPQ